MASEVHYADIAAPVLMLDVKVSFEQLSKQEKFYAHFMREYTFVLDPDLSSRD
jgi:hypothetical protein